MLNLRSKLTAVLLGVAGLTSSAQADCWDPCNDCCIDFEIGADWLYWSPCINDQHFAVSYEGTSIGTDAKTHYFCDEWDSGVRVWGKLGNCWNGFNGYLFYTYINPSANGEVEPATEDSVRFSNANPSIANPLGDSLTSEWEMKYQSLDALLSYSINVTQNRCLYVEAFSGLTWIDVNQDREDVLYIDPNTESEVSITYSRHNDFWAIGPCFGLYTSYKICDCFNIFGVMKTNLVVGESKSKDTFEVAETDIEESGSFTDNYHAKDECFCFPGLHLMAGIDYELCLCDCEFGIRLGWEYVQWINAPTFPYYEDAIGGARSAPSTNDLTMQGIFVGLHASF